MPKIINICVSDWANASYEYTEAMRSVGLNAHSYKKYHHHFGYDNESEVLEKESELEAVINSADIVQIMHSNTWILKFCKKLKKKNLYVYHTGTTYRNAPDKINLEFNPYIIRAFTDQTEFIGTGMKNEYYFTSPVNADKIEFSDFKEDKITVAHFPSSMDIKGTTIINRIVNKLRKKYDFNYIVDGAQVSHKKQIDRMSQCDIYIELFSPMLNGKKYGCFGVTALEAAALGKIVVTNHSTAHIYKNYYGVKTPFVTPQTEKELYSCLEKLMQTPEKLLHIKKLETRQWLEKYHSYQATGLLIKKLLNL